MKRWTARWRTAAVGLISFGTSATLLLRATEPATQPIIACAWERFDRSKLGQMDAEMNQAIGAHQLPGGVLWLESKGKAYYKAFGSRALVPQRELMTEDTIFDVASLTKVLATTPAVMLLYERNQLKLDQPVVSYLPQFHGLEKEAITIKQLLTHTSGIGRSLGQSPDWSNLDRAFQTIAAEPLLHAPGSAFLYSDINFIMLGEIVKRVSGMKLEQFVAREIYEPLKMSDTGFLASPSKRARIAPTEVVGNEIMRGIVHDPKARAMGGVAGHAGIFTTAADIARFARMLLHGGVLDGVRVFRPETIRLMTTVQTPPDAGARRGLGWDIDSDFSRPRGNVFPLGSYGHTGFTGVCLWIDPYSESFWMLLSNRVHPDATGNISALQRKLATLGAEAIRGFDFQQVKGALPPASSTRLPPNITH